MAEKKRILVFRFSAMGDVAMLAPVLKKVLLENSTLEIILVTHPKFDSFFYNIPNLSIFKVDFGKGIKGFGKLINLFLKLKFLNPIYILDLHQNIRTTVLKTLFKISGKKTFTLNKGRKEKKSLIKNEFFEPLISNYDRYLNVFLKAGLIQNQELSKSILPGINLRGEYNDEITNWLSVNNLNKNKIIGIAPFAQHKGKMWPLENFESLFVLIQNSFPEIKILLFGGGEKETKTLESLEKKYKNCLSVAGKFNLSEELALISNLKFMLACDSSNMHFAALLGIETFSIWGSTHRFAGFAPIFQNDKNIIEISKEQLSCRPCSVYGNKSCARGDYACLHWISPEMVFEKIKISL